MGTSPGAGYPSRYDVEGGFAALEDGKAKAIARDNVQLSRSTNIFQRGIQVMLAGVVNLFGGALLGSWKNVNPEDIEIRDGQLALRGRTDLLAGVNGYCCAFQTLNITTGKTEPLASFGWLQKWSADERMLPYNEPLGPSKGAHVDGTGIVFDEPGLWTVYVLCRRKNNSDTYNNPKSYVKAHIFDGSGEEYAIREFSTGRYTSDYTAAGAAGLSGRTYPDGDFSVTMVFPIVIPSSGYRVSIGVTDTSKNTWWLGGTNYATLAVLKHDNRTVNPGLSSVPNEAV